MGTTTFEAIRTTAIGLINDLTPVTRVDRKFRSSKDHRDFRAWVDSDPKACFRRFSIQDVFDYEIPEISNGDVEDVRGACEVMIGYPTDFRYGADTLRDKRDVMREDFHLVDDAIGHRGYGNFADGSLIRDSVDHEESDAASILVIRYRMYFWREMP